jgi:hypothetical protein
MLLTSHNIAYYLIERGLVDFADVVNGDLVIAETTRRNRNFRVIRRERESYFAKQIQNWNAQAIGSLQCEAACYSLAQAREEFAPLAELMPAYRLYDPSRHVLVTQLLPNAEDLASYHRRLGHFPEEIAVSLGRLLGGYHRTITGKRLESPHTAFLRRQVPWILQLHEQHPAFLTALSPANTELLRIVRSYPDLSAVLDALRRDWQPTSLIHGDMKWDNCVICRDDGEEGPVRLKIVDWEIADIGDPSWDVGAILQAYVSFWLLSIPMSNDGSRTALVDHAQYPLARMQPAIKAFWDAYATTREWSEREKAVGLERSVKYGAGRMIQTAYEYMQYAQHLTPAAINLLQVSLNMLTRPADAIHHLLGM